MMMRRYRRDEAMWTWRREQESLAAISVDAKREHGSPAAPKPDFERRSVESESERCLPPALCGIKGR